MGYSDIKNLLKDAKNFATGANDLQLKGVLLDIQDAVFELQDENRELKDEIIGLKNRKLLESELVYKHSAYFKEDNEERAYCTKCYDVEMKLIIMRKEIEIASSTYTFVCPSCKNEFVSDIKHNANTDLHF